MATTNATDGDDLFYAEVPRRYDNAMGFGPTMRVLVLLSSVAVPACVLDGNSYDPVDTSIWGTGFSTSGSGNCSLGADGCACTVSGVCDPGLTCVDEVCVVSGCHLGGNGCACTPGGGCDPWLICAEGLCWPPGNLTGSTTDDPDPPDSSTGEPTSGEPPASGTDATTEGAEGGSTTGDDHPMPGWGFRRPLLLFNNVDALLVDVQVRVPIAADDAMNPDYSDLRFTDDGQVLPHWIESSNQGNAEVWVRVPTIEAGAHHEIELFYGNPSADDVADGEATFEHFDDFSGIALDSVEWTATGIVAVTGDQAHVQTGSVYSNEAVVAEPDVIVEARVRWPAVSETNEIPSGLAVSTNPNPNAVPAISIERDGDSLRGFVSDGVTTLLGEIVGVAPQADVPVWLGLATRGSEVVLEVDRGVVGQSDLAFPSLGYALLGDSAGAGAGGSNVDDMAFDLVLVRKYVATPPGVFVGAEEAL